MLLILLVSAFVLWAIGRAVLVASALPPWLAGALAGAVVAKATAEGGRRLNDVGLGARAGGWIALGFGVAFLASLLVTVGYDTDGMAPITSASAVALAGLTGWPGRPEPNRYGPPPPGALSATTAGGGAVGLTLAVVAVVAGAVACSALAGFVDGVHTDAERNWRTELGRRQHQMPTTNVGERP